MFDKLNQIINKIVEQGGKEMPKYTYRCNDCGYEFEKRQRMTEAPLTDCIECSGTVRRVVNSVGVVFKGSGFYVTDNRGKNAKGQSGSNGTTTSTTTSNDGSSSKSSSDSGSKDSSTPPSSSNKKATTTASATA